MNRVNLMNDLYIDKMDVTNEDHFWLARELDKDESICGENGYLWSIEKSLNRAGREYLSSGNIYGSPYAIYHDKNPIGYLEISKIYESIKAVDIAYALLPQYRGNGYACVTLKSITEKILLDIINDIQRVMLQIDIENIKSQIVATRAGFIDDGLSLRDHKAQGYIGYQKTKGMLMRGRHFM